MGDVLFEGNEVIAEGSALKVEAPDIKLDFASRRTTAAGERRALVHDFQDGLTINWAEDYPNGVTIRGVVKTPQELATGRITGNHLRLDHHDLHLDNSNRRTSAAGNRRAFVHDFQDGLTINWAEDYPGGVTIRGIVNLPQGLAAGRVTGNHLRLSHHDLHLDNASRRSTSAGSRRALVHDFNDGLTINWGSDYPGGVTIRGSVSCPQSLHVGSTDVGDAIRRLETKVQDLETRLVALEPASP